MAQKLPKDAYPIDHGPDDFECFAPAATKDGEFEGTMLADMGCFNQAGKDSNKYYHTAVVRSKKTQQWYEYREWGRQEGGKPSKVNLQFIACSSRAEAEKEYAKQAASKNVKRGQWVQHPTLGRILQPKAKDDCYLVQSLATRCTGLPDAQRITNNNGAKVQKITVAGTSVKSQSDVDPMTVKLMRDLNVGTVSYTKTSMAGATLPNQSAIDEGRTILTEAQKRVRDVGYSLDDQVNDRELVQLTSILYSRIPKKKPRNVGPEKWILSQDNIAQWLQDLDAFESALYANNLDAPQADPFGGMKIKMKHLSPTDPAGEFVYSWFPKMTRLKHGFDECKILNAWSVDRDGDTQRLVEVQKKIAAQPFQITEKPLHQPPSRPDLSREEQKLFVMSNSMLGIHGTRSVNVPGLLRTSWRLPKELVGVKITAWMFGPGIYIADDWGKSVMYTSHRRAIYVKGDGGVPGRGAFMFLLDAALGSSYIAPQGMEIIRPPGEHHSVCGKKGHTLTKDGYPLKNNEFIVYDVNQCRAKYLIEFDVN
jgi:hypothetical protein